MLNRWNFLKTGFYEGIKPEYEQLLRDTHLAVAIVDAGEPLTSDIDPRVVELVSKHRPAV